jgi:hypothetical protein
VKDSENFAQELPKLELWLQRYDKMKLQGPICNFWKVARANHEYFSNPKVLFKRNVDCGLIMDKCRGLFVRWWGFFWFWNYFTLGNDSGLDPWLMDHWRCRSTVDYNHGRLKGSLVLGLAVAPAHGGSPVMEQWREEHVGSPSRASPGCGRQCGDR